MSARKYNLRSTPQSRNNTPSRAELGVSHQKLEPVFKTPMTFSPRVFGDARPSPSRNDMLKAQLGFDDSEASPHDSQESGDDDDDALSSHNKENEGGSFSLVEYQMLVRELSERNTQRDDLLLKLKQQQDKTKQYKQRVEKDELMKKQQIKILRMAHEASLQEKENLISNLECIIEEHEAKVAELQQAVDGEYVIKEYEVKVVELQQAVDEGKAHETTERLGLHRLVRQISDLQSKNTELYQRALTSEHRVSEQEAEVAALKDSVSTLNSERNELQDDLIKMRSSKSSDKTDDQKLVHKLERENDRLRAQLRDAEQQLRMSSAQMTADDDAATSSEATSHELQKLKDEQTRLQEQVVTLQGELTSTKAAAASDSKAKAEELSQLKAELHELSQQNRSLNSRLVGLQAKSPEVVTKIKTVEVESASLQEERETLKTQLQAERTKLAAVDARCRELEAQNVARARELEIAQDETVRLQAQCSEIKAQNTTRAGELEVTHAHTDQLKAELSELITVNAAQSKQIASLNETIVELRSQTAQLTAQKDKVTEQLHVANNENARVTQELKQVRAENKLLTSRLEQLGADAEQQQSRFMQAQQEIVQKDADIEVLISETNILKDSLQQKDESLDASSRQLAESAERVKQLELQLSQYGEEVRNLQQQMELEIEELKQTQAQSVIALQAEHDAEVKDIKCRLQNVSKLIRTVATEFQCLKEQYCDLRQQCCTLPDLCQVTIKDVSRQIADGIAGIHQHNQELLAKYRKEMTLRKKYHNDLVELRGNIRVYCRVRPRIKEDGQGLPARNVVSYDAEDDGILSVLNKGRVQSFDLDRVFHADYNQEQVYNEVTSLVTSCVDGYNVCIFAYGQTGSGKTYTMEGTANDPGINQRALTQLFAEAAERDHVSSYTIHVSVLEIYNELIHDLLSATPGTRLDVKMHAEGGVHVPGLTSVHVQSVADVNEVFALGHKNRATASTNMNEHSSRSHALLCVRVVGVNRTSGNKTNGVLNLVDLAGSERVSKSGADGARLKEAQNINKSLSSLGDVIQALRTKQNFVPYRNSKLTYLLQDSLGGDSKTLMITQVAPVERNVGETLASLNFAQRVRTVELGQATKKTESAEIAQLKERLNQYEDVAQFQSGLKGSTSKLSPPSKVQRK